MPIKVATRWRIKLRDLPTRYAINDAGKSAGAACKGDCLRLGRMRNRRMATVGQAHTEKLLSLGCQSE